jgi:hypothetical protein
VVVVWAQRLLPGGLPRPAARDAGRGRHTLRPVPGAGINYPRSGLQCALRKLSLEELVEADGFFAVLSPGRYLTTAPGTLLWEFTLGSDVSVTLNYACCSEEHLCQSSVERVLTMIDDAVAMCTTPSQSAVEEKLRVPRCARSHHFMSCCVHCCLCCRCCTAYIRERVRSSIF